MTKERLTSTIFTTACVGLLGLASACNHGAAPEPNASHSEQKAAEVKTPSGGGTETTNQKSIPERPPTAENIQMGSAVPPAAADQTRPHPQQQITAPEKQQQSASSSTPSR